MEFNFDTEEIRVLGALIEKKITTPDYYPLSLKALVQACNQKSNRNPVVSYTEDDVLSIVERLRQKQMVWKTDVSRVSKYEEQLLQTMNIIPKEAAVLCVLMLRGPQTLGEIRGRTERMYEFNNLSAVERTMESLVEMGLAEKLERFPGQKENRYAQIMSGKPDMQLLPEQEPLSEMESLKPDRLSTLETEITTLRGEFEDLKKAFLAFKEQFE